MGITILYCPAKYNNYQKYILIIQPQLLQRKRLTCVLHLRNTNKSIITIPPLIDARANKNIVCTKMDLMANRKLGALPL